MKTNKFDNEKKNADTLKADRNKELKSFGLRFLTLLVVTSAIYIVLYNFPFFRDIVGKNMANAVGGIGLFSLVTSSIVSGIKKIYRHNLSNKRLIKKLSQKYDKALDLAHSIALKNHKLDFRRIKLSKAANTADIYYQETIKRIAKARKKESKTQKKLDRHITSTRLSDKLDKRTEVKERLKDALRENAQKDKEIVNMVGGVSKSKVSTSNAIKKGWLAPNYKKELKEKLRLGKGNDEKSLDKMSDSYMYNEKPLDDYNDYDSKDNTILDHEIND